MQKVGGANQCDYGIMYLHEGEHMVNTHITLFCLANGLFTTQREIIVFHLL